jgi:hypothetical protein
MNRPDEGKPGGESIDEQLVAYLDGELDAEAQQQIERQLSEDAWSRDRVRHLQQAWDLLDHLPHAQTDRSFTETTVELVAAKASEQLGTQQRAISHQRNRSWIYGAGALAAALALGYLTFVVVSNRRLNQVLRDLPIVENFDLYRQSPSVEFLQQLGRAELFAAEELEEDEAARPDGLFTQFDLASLRQRAKSLTPVEKAQLQRQKERFDQLTPEARQRMRQVHASVMADPNSDQLLQLMAQYGQWLQGLRPGVRAQLQELPPDERLVEIERIKREQDARRFHWAAQKTRQADFFAIMEWLREYVERHEKEIVKGLSEEERRQWDRSPWGRRQIVMQRGPLPTDEEIDQLAERLSPEARKELTSEEDRRRQFELVDGWMQAAFVASRRGPHVSDEELGRFFQQLDKETREKLTGLSPEELQSRLRWEYARQHGGRGGRRGGPRWEPRSGPRRDHPEDARKGPPLSPRPPGLPPPGNSRRGRGPEPETESPRP